MARMSAEVEARGGKSFALFPVRRAMVPKHIRFCAQGFHKAMEGLRNERLGRGRRAKGEDEITLANSTNSRAFSQAWRLEPGFTTDGVSVRVQQTPGSRAAVHAAREAREAKKESRKRAPPNATAVAARGARPPPPRPSTARYVACGISTS